ncbi:hypothetical protein VPFG_00260 [Vibrio phage nt-1]|uniref:Uncharacterized protein n=1 Tax=Vibrio phage nt-1 TaxID=115992 RepID=R9TFK0_9CAUD|nr:hypothetical protein VPFG_00260 [Vibrio phage nt-1]AGN30259.1 hypothetical protein VPFG_00260 [Vibrio phage nt-1]
MKYVLKVAERNSSRVSDGSIGLLVNEHSPTLIFWLSLGEIIEYTTLNVSGIEVQTNDCVDRKLIAKANEMANAWLNDTPFTITEDSAMTPEMFTERAKIIIKNADKFASNITDHLSAFEGYDASEFKHVDSGLDELGNAYIAFEDFFGEDEGRIFYLHDVKDFWTEESTKEAERRFTEEANRRAEERELKEAAKIAYDEAVSENKEREELNRLMKKYIFNAIPN